MTTHPTHTAHTATVAAAIRSTEGRPLGAAAATTSPTATAAERRRAIVALIVATGVVHGSAPDYVEDPATGRRRAILTPAEAFHLLVRYGTADGSPTYEEGCRIALTTRSTHKGHLRNAHKALGAHGAPEACVEGVRIGVLPYPSADEIATCGATPPAPATPLLTDDEIAAVMAPAPAAPRRRPSRARTAPQAPAEGEGEAPAPRRRRRTAEGA